MISNVEYEGLSDCVQVSNGEAKLIFPVDMGPRILFYGFENGENILGWHPDAAVETDLGTWKPYGGHRLWMAPENMPLSYAPDNERVDWFAEDEDGLSVRLRRVFDAAGVQKEMVLTLAETGTKVMIEHRLTVTFEEPAEFAAWSLTILRAGGEVIIPNEPFAAYSPETLLPVRSLALWPYTDLTDARWTFGVDHIRLRIDEGQPSQQKIGVLNTQGWAAYEWQDLLFTKRFEHIDGVDYPDMNSNLEVYTAGGFVELETLSPLVKAEAGKTITHTETWELEQGRNISELNDV